MKDANLGTLFLPVLAIFTIFLPFALQAPNHEADKPIQTLTPAAQSTPAPTLEQPNNAAALVCEFASPKREVCQKFWEGTEQNVKSIENFAQNVAQVETLIATVPDPQESSFDYSFDRYLEAIQRALEATGYTIDRYDLPWLTSNKEDEKKDEKKEKSASAVPPRARATNEPGVILFRKNVEGKTYLLALFLIGETPTQGIHKTALLNALEQAKRLGHTNAQEWARVQGILLLCEDLDHNEPKCEQAGQLIPPAFTIRLLGPTYTGSATSLAITLQSWLERKCNADWKVNIISGGATAIKKQEFLLRANPAGKTDRVCFAATVTYTPSDLNTFIKNYLPRESKIAILRESNTTYGETISRFEDESRQLLRDEIVKLQQVPKNDEQQQKLQELQQELQQERERAILQLPFPLNISELRTAAEKVNAERTKKSVEANPAERRNVPLGMGQGKATSDVVPLTSKVEIASREMVLANLLSTIKREEISYLGLAATNVQDRIFLVREIRQHAPNVMIFMLSSDLLHLHSEARVDFRGVLMVTPYSLFNQNQRWTYPFKGELTRLQFPAHGTQGTYNATLALLNHPKAMLEYGAPFDFGLEADGVRKPSLWVSVVGRDRVWPIKTLNYEDEDYLFKPKQIKKEDLPTYASFKNVFEGKAASNPNSKDAGEVKDAGKVIADLPETIQGALSSKTPLVGMLLLILIGCVPSAILLLELMRTKGDENINPFSRFRKADAPATSFAQKMCAPLVPSRYRLVQWIASWPIFKAIDRSPLARIFSDPVLPDPRLKFQRRCYLMVCSLILFGLALTVAVVDTMPIFATLRLAAALPDADLGVSIIWQVLGERMTQYFVGSLLALGLLLLTFLPAFWMTASILDWIEDRLRGKSPSLLHALLEKSGRLLNNKVFTPLKTYIEAARATNRPLPLSFGWLIFVILLIIKSRFAVSVGLLTATSFVYWDVIWNAPRKFFDLIQTHQPHEDILFSLRAVDLMSGVSPLMPLLFVGVAAFLAFFSALRRLSLAEQACCAPKEIHHGARPLLNFGGVETLETKVKELLWCSFRKLDFGWPVILLLVLMCILLFVRTRSLEGGLFDLVFGLAFSIAVIFLALAFLRFFWLWRELQKLLRHLSLHPLFLEDSEAARAFFKRLPKIQLTALTATYSSMVFSMEQAIKALRERQNAFQPTLKEMKDKQSRELEQQITEADEQLEQCRHAETSGDWRESLRQQVKAQRLLAKISASVAQDLENHHWEASSNVSDPTAQSKKWIEQGKLFLASRVTAFLLLVLAQLKNLVVLVTAGSMLILLAVSAYPFQPREWLMLFGWVSVLMVVGVTLMIFVQMGRDRVISLLSHTTPGEVNWSWDFTLRVLIHGLLPIMALLGAQFPHVIGQIISWFNTLQGGHY